ncbi:MAG: tetratricopeptide repeat protein [Flammeovirgaceae bacterium]|nr:tetratricopeptide repeat protein [Flammeovirgaceae bacterium]
MHFSSFCKLLLPVSAAFLLWTCSSEQNSVTSNIYHNSTAQYNGYFYAREKAREVEAVLLKSLDDDPTEILRLFPKLDTTLAKTYQKDTEEIIKMASISIQRHPNSKWVDDNYVMVGLARLYDCDYQNAIQTFKYVNTKSNDNDIRHVALIQLVRTFTEMGEWDKAEEAFRFVEKENLNKINRKNLLLQKAYYYQTRVDYDNMVRNLTLADTLLTRKDGKGRIYFLIGQIYQKLGFSSEAYNYYRKCLSISPSYEIEFYARLNLAQVARLDDSRDVKVVRKQFAKLLSDAKNVEFRDKIYYELGEFEFKQGNLEEAISNYELAADEGMNKRIQGSSFLRIGQIYFDSLQKYSIAKSYYDSAVAALPPDLENYEDIKKRREILIDFVKFTETIQWQDSLLQLSTLDSAIVYSLLDSTLKARTPIPIVQKKKKRNESNNTGSNNNSFFQGEKTTTSSWYFENPSAVALGQSEFKRIWGNIPLEDNWRISTRTIISIADNISEAPQKETEEVGEESDNGETEILNVFNQLPKSDEQKEEALSKIEDAYFALGDLYYIQLNQRENASKSYIKLLNRFPESHHVPEVLYKLFLIHKDDNIELANQFADRLKIDFPNSTYTRVMLNPDYLKETSVAAEKQKLLYKEIYENFSNGNLKIAQDKLSIALELGDTGFTPQLELISILITGKTEDITQYQYELTEFTKKYPDSPLVPYVEVLLASSKSHLESAEKSQGIRFIRSFDEPHYFVIVHPSKENISNVLITEVDRLNNSNPDLKNLKTSNLILTEEYILTYVIGLPDPETALNYRGKIDLELMKNRTLSTYKFDTFVITKDNFDIFYRTKGLDEYLAFFDRNY